MKLRILLLAITTLPLHAQKFYHDDPLLTEPAPRDASGATPRKISDYYDFFLHTFGHPGERQVPGEEIPSQAVNTLGDPMDGAWYTKRHYYRRMTIEELKRGPGNASAPATDQQWTIVKAKSEGVTPGFEIVDSKGRRYVLKFDPPNSPGLATAPDVLVSKFFYALGYHVPENYIVHFAADQLKLKDGVMLTDQVGKKRPMTRKDLDALLTQVPRNKDGLYRAVASLYLAGTPLGPFKYFGTRKDDPNDTVAHEHRRDLRALRVFAAWLGHDDSRAINSLDMLVKEGGTPHIRHYLIDFGSTLGSASYGANSPRSGFEYTFQAKSAIHQLLTLGMAPPDWARARYVKDPAIGRFESVRFDPAKWVPEYPNPAFENMLPEDAFWAAKQVMAFTDDEIHAMVETGEYQNPATAWQMTQILIHRRDKIGRAYLTTALPLDGFVVVNGKLTFDDLGAVHHLVAPRDFTFRWYAEGSSGFQEEIPTANSPSLPAGYGGLLRCEISHGGKSLRLYIRAASGQVVGISRI